MRKILVETFLAFLASSALFVGIVAANQSSIQGDITLSSCDVSAVGPINFGTVGVNVITPTDSNPSTVSASVSNTGSITTTTLTVAGSDWLLPGSIESSPTPFVASSTHFSSVASNNYATMAPLTTAGTLLGNLEGGASQTLFFRVMAPAGAQLGAYTQQITFTSGC